MNVFPDTASRRIIVRRGAYEIRLIDRWRGRENVVTRAGIRRDLRAVDLEDVASSGGIERLVRRGLGSGNRRQCPRRWERDRRRAGIVVRNGKITRRHEVAVAKTHATGEMDRWRGVLHVPCDRALRRQGGRGSRGHQHIEGRASVADAKSGQST